MKVTRRARKSRLGLFTLVVLLTLGAVFLVAVESSRPRVGGEPLRLDEFVDLAERGRVKTATVLDFDSYLVGSYERDDGTIAEYNTAYLRELNSRDALVGILLENRIATTINQQTSKRVANFASYLLPGVALVVLFGYMILSSRRGTGLFGIRSGARRIGSEKSQVTFADVAGQEAAMRGLFEVKEFLADPKRFARIGARVPRGVLLYGPPGCGKTLMARALAGEAGATFYSISGSDFVELYVGVGAARVRNLFKEARENSPAVVFIDELDSVGRTRAGAAAMGANQEQEQALNQILAEMDGFTPSEGIVVLGATNRPDILDPALLRPGRFDRTIGLERPDEAARLAILRIHGRDRVLAPNVDLAALARKAVGMTGADLNAVVNDGALNAASERRSVVSQADLESALAELLAAPERQRRLSLRERSVGRRFADEERVSFADVAGQESAVAELREIKTILAEPERYRALGATVPKGVLLYGPPGCGKTLLASALASEANAAFFSVGAGEFVEVLLGQGASRVRDLFAEAKQMAPAIIFIDELDSLGRSRGGVLGDRGSAHAEHDQALNQILSEMDGISQSDGVIVVGATNRPSVLDPALLRPGRFDRTIGLELPDEAGRLEVLRLKARSKVIDPQVDLADIAGRAHGLTGADLANLLNEAAMLAVRKGRASIGAAELDEALQRTLQAPERQRRLSLRSRSVGNRYAAGGRVTFADVAGMEEVVEELTDLKDYLADPGRLARMGASAPRGVLLSGPPGCGKTLLARALAGEANAAFISASASEFVEVFVGEGAARVRDLFAEARAMSPSIVFLDEIDAIGSRRSVGGLGGNRELEQTLNQILVELDGFEPQSAVIVVAATNRPDMLDSALVRPGRFDRKVDIPLPDRAGRRAILAIHSAGKPLADDLNLDVVAGRTQGFTGADLANVMNEAAILANRRDAELIDMQVVDEALDRAYLGIAGRRFLGDDERRVVAYHEAGHALVARTVDGAIPPYKLTIAPRGGTLGHCSMLDSHDRMVLSRSTLVARMSATLAGWVAEKLVFGESASGASGDIRYANDLARRMVCEYGMSEELGPLGSYDSTGSDGRLIPPTNGVVEAIRRLADEATERASKVLTANRPALDRIASALLETETLTAEELDALLAPKGRAKPAQARTAGRT